MWTSDSVWRIAVAKKRKLLAALGMSSVARERQWFTGIDRLGASELLQIALNKIGNAQEDARPVRCGSRRPFDKRFLCRSHGEIDIARIAVRHLRIWLSGCGLDVV